MRKLKSIEGLTTVPSLTKSTLVGSSQKHESADKHVSGEALYVDDSLELRGQLYAAVGQSTVAHGKIIDLDLAEVLTSEGVLAVISVEDVPGKIDIGPVFLGDPVLADGKVEYVGQPIFAVAATSYDLAQKAVKRAKIKYQELPAVLTIDDALTSQNFVRPSYSMQRGDANTAIKNSKFHLSGKISVGGQEHFYLEGQVSSAVPNEDGGMTIYSSTQHPSEVQKLVAEVLAISLNQVVVDTRRMGGAFGGKETQAAPWACIAALLANICKRPVKFRLSRQDDMCLTGKRHPFENSYRIGFDEQGLLDGVDITVSANCGYSPDLSDAIVDRAMFHSDNAYYLNQAIITGHRCKLNMVSNTAFRGFGGPQGMMTIEMAMDDIARKVNKDPLDIRKLNLYQSKQRNTTHYHQQIEHNNLKELIEQLEESSDYRNRRQKINQFNQQNTILKKGLALTPVKFGISFTVQHLNQAGALLHIYTDGTIHLNHGGTEMGQGLLTKVAQIVAEEFSVSLENIAVSSTRTDKVPNTSPTAASSGTDLNGKAAQAAARILKSRLVEFLLDRYAVEESQIKFINNQIIIEKNNDEVISMTFEDLVQQAYMARVSLSATGFYKTPKIHFDRASGKGRPFFYYATGAAVSEIILDTLTGEYKVLQVDILHDVGDSLNPALDIGQIEGGFVQGVGWLTTEELLWDQQGKLISNNAASYKIPAISDIPEKFKVELFTNSQKGEHTIYHSKAVGEPPLMLAMSVWSALRDGISSITDYQISIPLDTPATTEKVLWAVEQAQQADLENRKNREKT